MCLDNSVARIHPAVLGRPLEVLLNKGALDIEETPQCFALPPIIVPIPVFQKLEGLDLFLHPLSAFASLPLGYFDRAKTEHKKCKFEIRDRVCL